jgi:GT2 family glycosyltransferase
MVSEVRLMRSPTLRDLPPAQTAIRGWPWTAEVPVLPDTMPDGSPWPRVSVVTPSCNQGGYLEETIRSVLLQGYPNLEYLIMDGGSTDGSVDIIRKYEPWLAYWVSEPDSGQAAAVQEAWERSTGDVLAYLNSDDTYLPGAIGSAVTCLKQQHGVPAVSGGELHIDESGQVLRVRPASPVSQWSLLNMQFVSQPATFVRKTAFEQVGGLDTTFECAFDFEFWLRLTSDAPFGAVPEILATTRWHPETKTHSRRPQIAAELVRAVRQIVTSSDHWDAEAGSLMAGVYLKAASICFESPRHSRQAIRYWWTGFACSPALWRRFLRMLVTKTLWHVKRLVRWPWHSDTSAPVHWSDWRDAAHG